jgi:hypothetical protein
MKLLTDFFEEELHGDEPPEDLLRRIESLSTLTLDDLWEEEWEVLEL